MISIPALLSTGAWAAVTIGLIVAFGRTEGGAWSIVGGVARGPLVVLPDVEQVDVVVDLGHGDAGYLGSEHGYQA